jgi:AhpD family alkylhydroperoxidase
VSWIRGYSAEGADPRTRRLFERVVGPDGQIDNILRLHALRPHTLQGHMALYKSVLHHTSNRLPAEFLESLGVLSSALNDCDYCARHHRAGMTRAIADPDTAAQVSSRIDELVEEYRSRGARADEDGSEATRPPTAAALSPEWEGALRYAAKLTLTPGAMEPEDVESLRLLGLEDGEILEINQVVAYFAYANRTVLGLGATAEGEELGYHPSPTPDLDSWNHR